MNPVCIGLEPVIDLARLVVPAIDHVEDIVGPELADTNSGEQALADSVRAPLEICQALFDKPIEVFWIFAYLATKLSMFAWANSATNFLGSVSIGVCVAQL